MTKETFNTIVTLDVETTMKNTIGKNKASPFCPDNYIVMAGLKGYTYTNSPVTANSIITTSKANKNEYLNKTFNIVITPEYKVKVSVVIGQNIKFDLHHVRKANATIHKIPLQTWLVENKIWDTQLAEYLLTGQDHKYASLDAMSIKYGLPIKDDKVKEMFKKGIGADGIDEDILKEYLEQDLTNTEAIAFKQMQEAYDKKKLPLIESMMDALVAVADMEYNGLAIDPSLLKDLKQKAEQEVDMLEIDVVNEIKKLLPILNAYIINIDSNKQLSSILFGGAIDFDTTVPTTLKNGKTRNRHIKTHVSLPQQFDGESFSEPNANGFKIDEEVLNKVERISIISSNKLQWSPIIKDLLKRKKIKKELNTYYEGLSELIFPDGLIHHNINMCSTATGRPSSDNPNSQNIPAHMDSDVKKLFVSRWGEDGMIISADYKQIEIIALAYLSQDPQLIDDILNGRDIHEEVGRAYYGRSKAVITKDERRVIKTVNFGLIYGGTANSLAAQSGLPAKEVKKIIDAFYSRYNKVATWQHNNIDKVNMSRSYNGILHTPSGHPSGTGYLHSTTGRVYTFQEKDNPFRRGEVNFKPTEIKNYPVQGFATGDLVLTMTGVLWRMLQSNSKFSTDCHMVNLVHDELVFDCKKDLVHTAMHFIKTTLEDTPKYMKSIYGIYLGLPTKVKVTCGDNWKEQKVVAI